MLTKTCNSCGHTFDLKDTKVDEHWRTFSTEPAHCYCPICNSVLVDVLPGSVDMAKTLSVKFFVISISLILLSLFGLVTDTLHLAGSAAFMVFGGYLSKSASTRDHRFIGYFLIVLGIGVFLVGAGYA